MRILLMARYEAALHSSLHFHVPIEGETTLELLKRSPDTVDIQFEGRTFRWHAPEDSGNTDPGFWGPTLTVMQDADTDVARAVVADLLERLLSALAFDLRSPVGAISYGASGNPADARPVVRASGGSQFGRIIHPAPARVDVKDDEYLRLALAYFREGINASSPFYGFLAFWNATDAAFKGERAGLTSFLKLAGAQRAGFGGRPEHEPLPPNIPEYLRGSSRDAIAHVVRDSPGKAAISPDSPDDRRRLTLDRDWMRYIAADAIEAMWPRGVRVIPNL